MQEFTALEYLQIDIANLFGKDKLSWQERLAWFKDNETKLTSLIDQADSPNQFYAAILNYPKVAKGAVNHHPIALDATSSGLQLLSALTCDRQAAEYCNVLNTGTRVDAYTALYKKLSDKIGTNPMITREKLKKAIMTSTYGSQTTPAELFGYHVEDFYTMMEEECPLIWEINQFLTENWNPAVDSYGWVMPDNFHVHIKVYTNEEIAFSYCGKDFSSIVQRNAPSAYGRAYAANAIHSCDSLVVREITALAMHDPKQIKYIRDLLAGTSNSTKCLERNQVMVKTLVDRAKASGFLSARILDYIDAESIKLIDEQELRDLLNLVPVKPFEVLAIHDSFHTLPNYGNDLRRLYIAQLAKIARSNLLQYILDQMPVPHVTVRKGDPDMWKDVLNTEYALS